MDNAAVQAIEKVIEGIQWHLDLDRRKSLTDSRAHTQQLLERIAKGETNIHELQAGLETLKGTL